MVENPYVGMPIILGNSQMSRHSGCCSDNHQNNMNNGWDFDNMTLGSLPLAMSYVPFQKWQGTYPLDKALKRGTLFPELDLPFKGGMK